jgi:hypothetical protein
VGEEERSTATIVTDASSGSNVSIVFVTAAEFVVLLVSKVGGMVDIAVFVDVKIGLERNFILYTTI